MILEKLEEVSVSTIIGIDIGQSLGIALLSCINLIQIRIHRYILLDN